MFWLIQTGALSLWKKQTPDNQLHAAVAMVARNENTNAKHLTADDDARPAVKIEEV